MSNGRPLTGASSAGERGVPPEVGAECSPESAGSVEGHAEENSRQRDVAQAQRSDARVADMEQGKHDRRGHDERDAAAEAPSQQSPVALRGT